MPGKRVQFDDPTWAAIDLLVKESRRPFQDLAEEAFRDLLAKHHRAAGLREQLRGSLDAAAPDQQSGAGRPAGGRRRS